MLINTGNIFDSDLPEELEAVENHNNKISVEQTSFARRLLINDTIQGSSLLLNGTPGPIPEPDYQLLWCIIGLYHPKGKGVMLGLGSGSGAIGLLWNFPDIRLTVYENNKDVITLARKYFPLIAKYEQSGQLLIKCIDATTIEGSYNFLILDTITSDVASCPYSYSILSACTGVSNSLWINVITSVQSADFANLKRTLVQLQSPVKRYFSLETTKNLNSTRN